MNHKVELYVVKHITYCFMFTTTLTLSIIVCYFIILYGSLQNDKRSILIEPNLLLYRL